MNDDLTGSSLESLDAADDGVSSCSQNQVNSIMGYLADDCDFYNFSHAECVRWIEAGIYGPLYPRIKLDNMVVGLIGSGP